MDPIELRELDAARQFVLQTAMMQRIVEPRSGGLRAALEWSLVIAASGHPLPPVGFVGDLGHALSGAELDWHPRRRSSDSAGMPIGVARAYEDYVLGQYVHDESLARAGVVVRRLDERLRGRAIAFVIQQFRERSPFGGVLLSPGVIKGILDYSDADIVMRGWSSCRGVGLMPVIVDLYAGLIAAIRRRGEVLSRADVLELERGTALAELGQRLAFRQLLAMTARFVAGLTASPRPRSPAREVPSHVRDDDVYPVGGFASISTRGTVESLLQSQLAYMEQVPERRPDLFDVKFLRDELLYYSRDENQFLRRRQRFAFVFAPNLVRTRFKDIDLPAQRVICTLALICAAVQSLTNWLSADSLQFEFYFPNADDVQPLAHERALVELVFHDLISIRGMRCENLADPALILERAIESGPSAGVHTLFVTAEEQGEANADHIDTLVVTGPRPTLKSAGMIVHSSDADPMDAWQQVLTTLLARWVS